MVEEDDWIDEGSDEMVADLSFNQIEKIENLSTLTRLVDLSLYNNKITVFEGLDALEDLKSLSLGNNQLKELEKVCQKKSTYTNFTYYPLHCNPIIFVLQHKVCTISCRSKQNYNVDNKAICKMIADIV